MERGDDNESYNPIWRTEKTVILLHDNARPHAAEMTQESFLQLGWSVLPHPPHSPGLVSTDFHLCRFLQNALQNRKFTEDNQGKEYI
ncbi:hypothetical protein FHG87_000329 [Trinorchestia longiramus]|nr:hypothetical protein FHG87_000329 [Trinorchestia longiramus]